MRLYSDVAGPRTREIVGDVLALVVLGVGIVVAVTIYEAIAAFDAIGRSIQESGGGLQTTMTDIGESLTSIPLIGEGISAPFDAASGAGGTLADAGRDWQVGVHALATVAACAVAALVVVVVVFGWVRPRIVGVVRRSAVVRLARSPGSLELLAFRALTTRDPRELLDIDAGVVRAWQRGDPEIVQRLAALEMRSAGVVPPRG